VRVEALDKLRLFLRGKLQYQGPSSRLSYHRLLNFAMTISVALSDQVTLGCGAYKGYNLPER
jgi:hypothetical protein